MEQFVNKYKIIKQVPLFQQLNWYDLQRIARKSKIVEYSKGSLVSKEGNPADGFYCLVSGRLRAYTVNKAGIKDNVEFLHRGMFFGIISLLTGETHSLNFEALNDSVILFIDRESFLKILKDMPKLAIEISQTLSRRIRSKVTNKNMIFESKIVSVYSPVKDAGSSTYAFNLAVNLQHETNKKVMLLNIDSTSKEYAKEVVGEETTAPEWKEASTTLLHEIIDNEEKTFNSIVKDELNIDFLNVLFDHDHPELIEQISRFVSAFANTYHFVVVDLPNDMNDIVIKTLSQSDLVHILSVDREQDLSLSRVVIDRLEERFKDQFDTSKVKLVLSGVYLKRILSDEQVRNILNYEILTSMPHIDKSQLTDISITNGVRAISADPFSDYGKVIRHIARNIGNVSVGLVLGGGAALGLAHIGVIKVLEEENIPIDIIVGSSMGALVGGFWALGNSYEELVKLAKEFEKVNSVFKLVDPIFPWFGLIGGKAIRRWLKGKMGRATFYDTKKDFRAVAYDLNRRIDLVIDRGSIVDAIHQSIAIPGIIKPVLKDDQLIIDGGVMNPLPTDVLVSRGVKKIIAVNVLQSPYHFSTGRLNKMKKKKSSLEIKFLQRPLSYIGVRISSWFAKVSSQNISNIIVQTLQASEYVIAEQTGKQADVLIEPDLIGIDWYELYRVDDLIRLGEEAARRNLPAIKELTKLSE